MPARLVAAKRPAPKTGHRRAKRRTTKRHKAAKRVVIRWRSPRRQKVKAHRHTKPHRHLKHRRKTTKRHHHAKAHHVPKRRRLAKRKTVARRHQTHSRPIRIAGHRGHVVKLRIRKTAHRNRLHFAKAKHQRFAIRKTRRR